MGDVTIPSVAETKAKCCELPTSLLLCPSGLCAMCFYQFGRHWLCNTAKPPHLEAKNHQVMGGQLPDSQKAAPFFPMSFPGDLGEAITQEGQVKSN